MKFIQIPLLLVIVFAVAKTVQRRRRGRLALRDFCLWLALWVSGGVLVLVPEHSNDLARILGVSRGADLVLYLSVVVLFYLVLQAHARIEYVRSDITELTRHLALQDLAALDEEGGSALRAGDEDPAVRAHPGAEPRTVTAPGSPGSRHRAHGSEGRG